MTTKKKTQHEIEPSTTDAMMQHLVRIAFGNIFDFARIEANGRVHIFDWDKAREVGAQVSVVTRKVGRGRNAREVRRTSIKMPNKVSALIKLIKHLSPARRGK